MAPDAFRDLYVDLLKKTLTGSLYDESAWEVLQAGRGKKERSPFRTTRFVQGLARAAQVRWLRLWGLILVRPQPFDPEKRNEGMDWPLIGYTMAGRKRLDNVDACVADIIKNKVPGDFIETGVWRGGTTMLMRALLKIHGDTQKKVWVADSFSGLPPSASKSDGPDISHIEYLSVSLDRVKANFARFGLLDDQVQFLQGWFADTLPNAPIEKLAILRLDGDLYSSTMDALKALYHKVSPGGYVIVDDYHTWKTCRQAVSDFLAERGLAPEIIRIDASAVYWQVSKATS